MMLDQAQMRCDALAVAMMDRGLARPDVTAAIKSNGSPWVMASWRDAADKSEYKHFSGDGMAECLRAAEAWVSALPSRDEAIRNTYLRMVADAADFGSANGLAPDFLAPVIAEMKRLSGNALTAAVA